VFPTGVEARAKGCPNRKLKQKRRLRSTKRSFGFKENLKTQIVKMRGGQKETGIFKYKKKQCIGEKAKTKTTGGKRISEKYLV